jgi:hypothetical protein
MVMDSAQKRERDRKQRQRRQDKEARRKERAEQKLRRGAAPAPDGEEGDSAAAEPRPEGAPPGQTHPASDVG